MNQFGGNWTNNKIEILVEYAKAYLTIMNKHRTFKTLYFDGFAGSGFIVKDNKIDVNVTVGAARRIVEIDEPRPFDVYYFVEKELKNFKLLEQNTKQAFPKKTIYAVCEDCNKKLVDLATFLRNPKNKSFRTLAYIDPCGMQLEWRSIENLRALPVDIWVLVPTGMGVNRLLEINGDISDSWSERLERFLGLTREEIRKYFYRESETLFPDIKSIEKEKNAIDKSAKLYQEKLKEVFDFVSKPHELNELNNVPFVFGFKQ